MLMAEKNTDTEKQTEQEPMVKRPEISHFGGKPIHPKVEKGPTAKPTNKEGGSGQSKPQTNKAKTTDTKRKSTQAAKLHDPDFAGKKAIKKPATKTEQAPEPKQTTKTEQVVEPKRTIEPVQAEASKATTEEKNEDKQEEPSELTKDEFLDKPQSKSRRHTLPAVVRVGFALTLIVGMSLLLLGILFCVNLSGILVKSVTI